MSAKITISLNALRHNVTKIKQQAEHSKIMAIVKANAYGHGLVTVAQTIQSQVSAFGVARVSEAIQLRNNGIHLPIVLLEGFFDEYELKQIVEYELETVVHSEYQIDLLQKQSVQQPIKVWLKLDTGMHRLGIDVDEFKSVCRKLSTMVDKVQLPMNVISHFSRADEVNSDYTQQQLTVFQQLTAQCRGEKSLAASAGILYWSETHFEWVRPGILLYGVLPTSQQPAESFGFLPAMTLSSHLIAIRHHKKGEPVGYGNHWRADRDTYIGVVALGYGDGYPRDVPAGTPVVINGKRYPIVGKVSMDMITVDLGDAKEINIGDEVIFWGKALPVEEVARHIGVITYELITRLTSRVMLRYY